MPLFTVDVGQRPVLVFSEANREAAEELVASLISGDLREFESGGVPLWDGQSELTVRDADAGEAERWQQGLSDARDQGAAGDDPDDFAVFLVELDEDEEDEEE
ncbi:hypothetical protein [Roseicella aquatilis]|uniref:Uncharacterized protein n=1 Tax=Roseicella aquatilis TaxID=2527868 RepID=A0A4R4D9C4_9PROT|nr:hypothetical protein [Roseicella aquatilis]TCZ56714.1 hypothetical protein EXY23_19205 [Roseicella aquatilis]